jgi:O-antigen ligase
MTRESFATALKIGAVVFLLFALLFDEVIGSLFSGFMGSVLSEITAVLRDPETQWMVILCLGIYFAAFLFLRIRAVSGFWRATNPSLWLVCLLLISAILYTFNYSHFVDALMLLAGAVLGQGAVVGGNWEKTERTARSLSALIVTMLVILLALASAWKTSTSHIFEYRGQARWSGTWDNPNIYGLLLGAGMALAAGMGIREWRVGDGRWRKIILLISCLVAFGLMGCGLLHSYSRGAWLATFCGLGFLVFHVFRCQVPSSSKSEILCGSCVSWFKNNWLPAGVILLSVVVLSFWHFRQTEWHPAHRAFSVSNQNDFSWRNRIAAWKGDMQMMAEKPWFGFGWNQPEPIYDYYYRAPKVVEGMAIQLNDYLMLGATLGIPALFCFGMYLLCSLKRNAECGVRNAEGENGLEARPAFGGDWIRITCRAGAIVLLVGFWFDGGLFKMATASTFWILLELGSVGNHETHACRAVAGEGGKHTKND